jgi:molybdopterin biosynthesis enzyme
MGISTHVARALNAWYVDINILPSGTMHFCVANRKSGRCVEEMPGYPASAAAFFRIRRHQWNEKA